MTVHVWLSYSVYCNGNEYEPARRVVLNKRMLTHSLSDILDEISQHLTSESRTVVTKYVIAPAVVWRRLKIHAPFTRFRLSYC